MGILNTVRGRKDIHAAPAVTPRDRTTEKELGVGAADSECSPNVSDDNLARAEKEIHTHPTEVTEGATLGVAKAEAAALVWSKYVVWAVYAWYVPFLYLALLQCTYMKACINAQSLVINALPIRIWICYLILALHSSIGVNVLYYAYSNFQDASQVSTASILASIVGGVLRLPIGKVLTLWGRAEALTVSTIIFVVAIIIMASCNGPQSYAAGYTLYWVGYDAIYLILEIFIADTSGIRNRAFAFAFSTTPFICTAFTGPLAATSFLKTSGWRWAYGAFAIIMPCVFAPLAIVFKVYERKAAKLGIYKKANKSGRTIMQSIVHYIHEFDVIGAILLMAAFVLFLLPFSLQTYGRSQYHEASFIAPVVVGFCMFFVFAAWEKWFARVHFIPYDLLRDPTCLGACCLAAILFFSFYSWDLYYYYFVMLVYNLDTTMTGYMTQIYNVGSCFWSVVFGLWIRFVKEFKYTCLGFALPLMILGAGLMIHFRGDGDDIGYIIMCQIFIAFAGGMLVIGQQMAVMCASDRNNLPIMLSVLSLSSSLGGAVGYAVSGAIYTNTFPDGLRKALPADKQDLWADIYAGGYLAQMTYAPGTPERDAINFAYGYSQKYGCIAATAILALAIPAVASWKHYRVDKQQNKGTVI
ncbi:hypothetical protein jhhlp_004877 [Lomentospora prolificans]|uniref:Major facilitator superfamily (MFS) profile domain-containing protein n=1 Tax=Lomentospora prolificans TaxID=41688 RepID=A0A2N3N7S0_9PEZI|nr:hypothetical protein jhhlp_004877 [Lomentospora prolificans]